MLLRRLVLSALCLGTGPLLALAAPASALTDDGRLTVAGSALQGASVPSGAVVELVGTQAVTSVRWVVDGVYQGRDTTAPFQLRLAAGEGAHRLKARADVAGTPYRYEASFTVARDATPPVPPSEQQPAPTPVSNEPVAVSPYPVRWITVDTAAGLSQALASARPGTGIQLADGTYAGRFRATADGTASAPVVLRGSRAAVLSGGSTASGYALHLDGASHWVLDGFTVRGAQKGIVLDDAQHTTLTSLDVGHTGQEAVHFRSGSSDNRLVGSDVHDTGLTTPGYGEGVYIGSASSNWDRYSGGQPDRSDRNTVVGNRIWATTAESIDIKEGTTGGLVEENSFDGSKISGKNYADSWLDVKGNGYRVVGNTGTTSPLDGFQTHVTVAGWGRDNVFAGNALRVYGPGYGIKVHEPRTTGNTVGCDNTVAGARSGLANLSCR